MSRRGSYSIELCEPAIIESLGYALEFEKYISHLLRKLVQAPSTGCSGLWFEYIVGAAVTRNYGNDDICAKKSVYPLTEYLQQINTYNTWVNPINQCGPDVVFMQNNTVWIIQAKIGKNLDLKHACRSTDFENFFCVRDEKLISFGQPLRGYSLQHRETKRLMRHKRIERIIVSPWANSTHGGMDPQVRLISPESDPDDFFCKIRPSGLSKENFWKILKNQG